MRIPIFTHSPFIRSSQSALHLNGVLCISEIITHPFFKPNVLSDIYRDSKFFLDEEASLTSCLFLCICIAQSALHNNSVMIPGVIAHCLFISDFLLV